MPLATSHPRRTSITSRVTGYVFLIITTCLLTFAWLVHTQLQWSVQQQADALGHTLLQQTRNATESALSADDTLSVAVLLRELVENPYVSHAALYSVDNRILAEAGKRPRSNSTTPGFYSQQLSFQDVTAGSLHLHIDVQKLQKPLNTSMQTMGALGITLLILAAFVSAYLGRSIARPLQNLSNWLINPAPPAPHIQRTDEIGLLARQLNQFFIDDTQTNAIPTLEDTEDASPIPSHASGPSTEHQSDAPAYAQLMDTIPLSALDTVRPYAAEPTKKARTAILAVELGSMEQLRQLQHDRLTELLKKYHNVVEQSAALYSGRLHTLADGRSLIAFDSEHDEYPRNALCCGELLRAFGHALQIEVADTGIVLQVQLGLSEGPAATNATLGELLLSETAQTALTLSQHSRNLLLLSDSLAQHSSISACARTRSIAIPEQASCLESLLNPYPALLQSQLHAMQNKYSN